MSVFSDISGAVLGGASFVHGLTQGSDFDRNANLQREFAQNGLRWRVADAKAAGLHPLAALGTSPTSASPIFSAGGGGPLPFPDFSSMGQNAGRASTAGQSAKERKSRDLLNRLEVDRSIAQNKLIDAQTRAVEQDITTSQFRNSLEAVNNSSPAPGIPSSNPSGIGDAGLSYVDLKNADGTTSRWPSQAVSDLISENPALLGTPWMAKNFPELYQGRNLFVNRAPSRRAFDSSLLRRALMSQARTQSTHGLSWRDTPIS